MKKLIAIMGIMFLLIVGCSNTIKKEEQNIEVQKRMGHENNYEDFKEITDQNQVQRVRDLLDKIDWQKAKVEMSRPADYRFTFQYTNPKIIQEKNVWYELWVSPNKDQVELVIDAESKYIHLDKEKSAELFEIITGENLQ